MVNNIDFCINGPIYINTNEPDVIALNSITAPCNNLEYTISSSGSINFKAPTYILLKNGFYAQQGCNFSASLLTSNYNLNFGLNNENNTIQLKKENPDNFKRNKNMPAEFSLSQNYPNPFNPSTIIKYDVPENCNITMKVYDVLGKLVTILINNEYKTAGYYTVIFNGENYSSGIYFYELNTKKFKTTKKMLLIK